MYKYNNIYSITNIYKIKLLNITHDIIHNDIKLPIYFKNLLTLNRKRRGLIINTQHRNNSYGDNILSNIMHDIWNSLPIEIRENNDKNIFNNNLRIYLNNIEDYN